MHYPRSGSVSTRIDIFECNFTKFSWVMLWKHVQKYRCRNKQIFGGAKDFCPNFSKLAQKLLCNFCRPFLVWPFKKWSSLVFLQTLGENFLKLSNVGRHFYPNFQGFFLEIWGFCLDFQGFCPNFRRFSTNQLFWGCTCTPCTPASYTTVQKCNLWMVCSSCHPHYTLKLFFDRICS